MDQVEETRTTVGVGVQVNIIGEAVADDQTETDRQVEVPAHHHKIAER